MKKYIIALLILLLAVPAFGAQTVSRHFEPEIPVLNTMAYGLGGTVIDGWYANQLVRVMKEQGIYSSAKFIGDANIAVVKDATGATSYEIDYSGNSNHALQPIGANQPIWTAVQQGTRAGLVYNGTSSFLSCGSIPFVGTSTYISLAKATNASQTKRLIAAVSTATRNMSIAGGYLNIYDNTNGISGSTALSNNTAYLFEVVHKATNSVDMFVNAGIQTPTGTTFSLGNFTPVVTLSDSTGVQWSGPRMTDLIFSAALTTPQRQAVEGVVNSYYSIY